MLIPLVWVAANRLSSRNLKQAHVTFVAGYVDGTPGILLKDKEFAYVFLQFLYCATRGLVLTDRLVPTVTTDINTCIFS